jgi:hypothetical protein
MRIKSIFTTALLQFLKNLTPWRGFEPGSTVLQADVMTTAPRRQGCSVKLGQAM